jgi:hypothetical protein
MARADSDVLRIRELLGTGCGPSPGICRAGALDSEHEEWDVAHKVT